MTRSTILLWQLLSGDKVIDVGSHGSWEEHGLPKDDPGPFTYRSVLQPVAVRDGERALLRFGAVSYACAVYVDDQQVGDHVGLWDSFEIDVTSWVGDDASHVVTVVAEKPASLTAGPDSPAVAGRYPTRQVLAGFLPYVWGHIHGGIWQPVELAIVSSSTITEITVSGDIEGRVHVSVKRSDASAVTVTVCDAGGAELVSASLPAAAGEVTLQLAEPRSWSPQQPYLYTVEVSLSGSPDRPIRRRFGLRSLGVGELPGLPHVLTLNGQPLYPRMLLSWGWYPDRLAPDPGPERVRADLELLIRLGFNGVKLCLWFPPDYYFEIADELGVLIWVELPMWLPQPADGFSERLTREADALVRQARRHPSVIIYTLGCELGRAVGPEILAPLYERVKGLAGDGLVCDNSGSGEAYGGADETFTDFYDHHLYTELEYLQQTFDHFSPRWRKPMPWLFGEICDYDTHRDAGHLGSGTETPPWWAVSDPATNPQGARWQFDLPFLAQRLKQGGWSDRGTELERIGRHGALLHRKMTTEYMRSRPDTSGYVITGERDTPISTAGLIDDRGALKVDADAFAEFTSATVLLLSPERRRRWVAGGDRPAPLDQWCHPVGSTMRMKLVVAHHGPGALDRWLAWTLVDGRTGEEIRCGALRHEGIDTGVHQVGVLEVVLPDAIGPVILRVRASVAGREITNRWTFWATSKDPWATVPSFGLWDPAARFADLDDYPSVSRVTDPREITDGRPLLVTRWSPDVNDWIRLGGRALVALDRQSEGPLPLIEEPFWRESIKVLEPHDWWGEFPNDGLVDLQFFGCATDITMDLTGLEHVEPLLRRLDARTGETHDYAAIVSWGDGQVLFTSLRFEGGRGDQPVGLTRNVGAAELLAAWMRRLGNVIPL